MNELQLRVLDISYRKKISHLSSTLSTVDIVDEIYAKKNPRDIVVLSNGHGALGLYAVLEKYLGFDAEALYDKHGVHPHRDVANDIHVSTGSLGMGITVAVGYALADTDRDVYCVISDGESGEGSVWEALRFAHEHDLTNLHVYANVNGQIAYDEIDIDYLCLRYRAFLPNINIRLSKPPDLVSAQGVLTHYYVLTQEDYQELCGTFSED